MTTKARTMSQLRKDEELADMTRKSKICVQWMEEKLGAPLPSQNLREALLDGVVLCKLANILKPGCIRQFHRQPRMLMMKMENIAFFLTACKTRLSVPQATLFAPTDVHDDSDPANMLKVLRVLLLLRGDFPGTSTEEATVGDFEEPEEIAEPLPEDHLEKPAAAAPAPATSGFGGEDADAALTAASAAAAAAKAAAEAAMVQAAALQAEAEAARAAAAAAAEARRVAAEKAAAEAAEKARLERERQEQERLQKEKERKAADDAAALAAAAAEKAAAAERALAAAERAAAERAAAAQAAAKTPASAPAAGGFQPEILAEITSAIHSELSLDSKIELLTLLSAQVRAAQAKIMSATDSELRSLCLESGYGSSLAEVPAGKPRNFYVEWLLKNGRFSS